MDFFKNVLRGKLDSKVLNDAYLIMESTHNHQIFRNEEPSSLETHVKSINALLSEGKKTREALAQLLILLPQCTKKLLSEEGERWIRLCSQALKKSVDKEDYIRPSLAIITFILKCCHDNEELFKKVSKLNASFLPNIYSIEVDYQDEAFECLYEFLLLFQLQAMPHKDKIEQRVIPVLALPFCGNTKTVCAAAKVFAALPVPGGGGVGGGIAEAKGNQFNQLISFAHLAADVLFCDVKENENYEFNRDHGLPITALKSACELNEPILKLLTSVTLLGNCFVFLQQFLLNAYPRTLLIRPKDLTNIAFRVLQVELRSLKQSSESMETTALAFILPTLHLKALSFLKVLVDTNSCWMSLNLIEEQVISTLRSVFEANSFFKCNNKQALSFLKANTSIKQLCYQILIHTTKVSKGFHKGHLENIVRTAIKDTVPSKDSLSLKNSTRGGRLSIINAKKGKKKGVILVSSDDYKECKAAVGSMQTDNQNVRIVESALSFIEALFLYAHHSLSLKIVRLLYNHLGDLLNLRRMETYANPKVRASLFSAIMAYALYPHPLCPPSYNVLCQALLSESKEVNQPKVSEICTKGLAALAFVMANPNTVNWSDIVRLHNEEKENGDTFLKEDEEEEPLLNGIEDDGFDLSDEDETDASDTDAEEKEESGDIVEEESGDIVKMQEEVDSDNESLKSGEHLSNGVEQHDQIKLVVDKATREKILENGSEAEGNVPIEDCVRMDDEECSSDAENEVSSASEEEEFEDQCVKDSSDNIILDEEVKEPSIIPTKKDTRNNTNKRSGQDKEEKRKVKKSKLEDEGTSFEDIFSVLDYSRPDEL